MTRYEAITRLKCWLSNGTDGMTSDRAGYIEGWFVNADVIAFDMAIKALEQEPCEDCISRTEAINKLREHYFDKELQSAKNDPCVIDAMTDLDIRIIKALPPVTPQPKMGRWITKDGKEQGYDIGGVKTWYIQIMCSECGFIKTAIEGHTGQYHYCPNCGAKMKESEEEE